MFLSAVPRSLGFSWVQGEGLLWSGRRAVPPASGPPAPPHPRKGEGKGGQVTKLVFGLLIFALAT